MTTNQSVMERLKHIKEEADKQNLNNFDSSNFAPIMPTLEWNDKNFDDVIDPGSVIETRTL